MLRRADLALYQAKGGGRNQIVVDQNALDQNALGQNIADQASE
jgi:hypothetical protein